jgi:hypothetical protein
MKRNIMTVLILVFLGTLVHAGSHGGATYHGDIRPLMEMRCFGCHGDHAPLPEAFDSDKEKYENMSQGPRMTSYELVTEFVTGSDAGAIMRRLDHGNMFIYLGETDRERHENLSLFKEWVGHWTKKRSDELTEADMAKFNLPR